MNNIIILYYGRFRCHVFWKNFIVKIFLFWFEDFLIPKFVDTHDSKITQQQQKIDDISNNSEIIFNDLLYISFKFKIVWLKRSKKLYYAPIHSSFKSFQIWTQHETQFLKIYVYIFQKCIKMQVWYSKKCMFLTIFSLP